MIAHARRDSRGKYSEDVAGDQDHGEVTITEWYNRPWNVILRAPRAKDRWKIAEIAEAIANNDNIGYDQNQRTTLYSEAVKENFDISKITTPCECDCSSMVAVCCIGAGFKVSPNIYTGNERAALKKVGFVEVVNKEILSGQDYILRGDILLYENHHTAVNLTDGGKIKLYGIGWQKTDGRWWYADTPTHYYHDCWKLINNYYYYFDSDGYALKGLHKIDGEYFYFNDLITHTHSLECALCHTNDAGALEPWKIN